MRWLVAAFMVISGGAVAQERRPSHCIAIADAAPGIEYLHKAAWQDPVPEFSVRISYVAHAAFMIQTRGGLNVVTDFTGFIGGADLIPDVVTMNHAHDTHWTAHPDPAIPHVLPGWGEFGQGIEHHLDLGEMLIRNVPTDIRSAYGGVEERGNSIFVFEVGGPVHRPSGAFAPRTLGRAICCDWPAGRCHGGGGWWRDQLDLPTLPDR